MKIRMPLNALLFLVPLLLSLAGAPSAEADLDHAVYASLLKRHVAQGQVDYKGFKQDESQLDRYLVQLGRIDPDRLDRSSQMAFYINLYNAATIKLILTGYPGIKSIKDLGSLFQSPWKKKFVALNGQTVTLDHIEHDILRPRFKDPRVHFAINCASKSCPPLQSEPYTGADLDTQLTRAATEFINDPQNNYVRDDTLYVSRIFKWFSQDFGDDIKGFIASYARNDLKRQLDARASTLKIQYLDYDWSLNGS